LATLHVYDEGLTGATKVIIQAGDNQGTVNLLEWQNSGGTVLGGIDAAGNLFVNTNTTLGDAAGDVVTVNAGTVALPNIPDGSTATEVLVWNAGNVERRSAEGLAWLLTGNSGTDPAVNFLGTTDAQPLVIRTDNVERVRITATGEVGIGTSTPAATLHVAGTVALPNIPSSSTATDEVLRIDPATGEVKRSTAADVISAAGVIKGSYSITTSGSSFTISVPGVLPGAIVTVTLVGPSGGTIYPLMVTNVAAGSITVESSASIPGGAGYAIHYIIINP
jgi:hypothetical protein